jgi:hypothetical protein
MKEGVMEGDKANQTSESGTKDQTQKPPENSASASASQAVTEGDLVAVKKGLQAKIEAAEKQATDEHSLRLQAEAKLSALVEKAANGAKATEELTQAKTALEAQTKRAEDAVNRALEHRRALVAKEYNIPVETLKDKETGKDYSDTELDMFEKAMKVVGNTPGSGRYATGGGSAGIAPTSSMDRAAQILANSKLRMGKGDKL